MCHLFLVRVATNLVLVQMSSSYRAISHLISAMSVDTLVPVLLLHVAIVIGFCWSAIRVCNTSCVTQFLSDWLLVFFF